MRPTEAYQKVLAEVRDREANAIDTNKPTMWAYFSLMADQLEAATNVPGQYRYTVVDGKIADERPETDDERVVRVMRDAVNVAHQHAEMMEARGGDVRYIARSLAETWALSVYAAKILRLSGFKVRRKSLRWLRLMRRP